MKALILLSLMVLSSAQAQFMRTLNTLQQLTNSLPQTVNSNVFVSSERRIFTIQRDDNTPVDQVNVVRFRPPLTNWIAKGLSISGSGVGITNVSTWWNVVLTNTTTTNVYEAMGFRRLSFTNGLICSNGFKITMAPEVILAQSNGVQRISFASGITVTSGDSSPTNSEPNGSLYLRTTGAWYQRSNDTWISK